MKYERALYFIYYGLIGNADDKCQHQIDRSKLISYCMLFEPRMRNRIYLSLDEYICCMSVDLIYRYIMKAVIGEKVSKPYPAPRNLFISMTNQRGLSSRHRDKCFAVEQLEVFHDFFIEKYEKKKLTNVSIYDFESTLLDDGVLANMARSSEECVNVEEDSKTIGKAISIFISLVEGELIDAGYRLSDDENRYPLSFYKAFALNLAKCFDSYPQKKQLKISSVSFLNWHEYVVMPLLFTQKSSDLRKTLLAFIDLFLCPAIINDEIRMARKEYVNDVFDITKNECGWPFAERCKKRISNLTTKYKGALIQYFNRVPFSIFKNEPWFDVLYKYAVKTNTEVEFVTLVLSLFPREKTDFTLVIDRANSAMTTELSREFSTKDACQLNVSISRDVDNQLRKICRKYGKSIKDFIEDAIVNECELYDEINDDEKPRHSSKVSADNGRVPRRKSQRFGLVMESNHEERHRRSNAADMRANNYGKNKKNS